MNGRCIFCDNIIIPKGCHESNDSSEHIILNAIGGMKRVRGFICIGCNSEHGNKSDQELAKILNVWCVIFGVKRERGEVPPEKITTILGEEYKLHSDGRIEEAHIKYKEEKVDGVLKKISISARNEKEAKKKIKELKNKYPKMKVDEVINNRTYLENPVKFNIGLDLPKVDISVVKSLISLVASTGKPLDSYTKIINHIKKKEVGKTLADVWLFYEKDLIHNRSPEQVLHCVSVYGDPENSRVIGYVEYFGFWRLVVILSEDYDGEEFLETYAIDPKTGSEIDLIVDLKSNSALIADVIKNGKINDLMLKNVLVDLMEKAKKADLDNQIKIIAKDVDAKANSLKLTQPNPTDEDLMKIANYGANEFVSMLQRGGFLK